MADFSFFHILIAFLKIFFCIFICRVVYNFYENRKCPPGPMGVPLLGYIPFLGKNPHLKITEIAKTYGDIISLNLRGSLLVCINEYHLGKKLLNHPLALNKPIIITEMLPGKGGFTGSNGPAWKAQRRFAMKILKDLGLGKGPWETQIQENVNGFVERLQKTNEEPFDCAEALKLFNLNNMFGLLLARPLDEVVDEEKIKVARHMGKTLAQLSSVENFGDVPPKWIMKLITMLNYKGLKVFECNMKKLDSIIRKEVNDKLKSLHETKTDDFITLYLHKINEVNHNSESHYFSVDCLVGDMFVFLQAGQDSSGTIVLWMLLLMTEYPEVQRKIHREIDEFIGRNGIVYFDGQAKLPYTMAVIQETMRYISPLLFIPPRWVEESFIFEGYTIPKGANITVNVWAIHHDPRNFEDPWEFKPERFLTKDGTRLNTIDGLCSFSLGKRNCPGERIAMMIIYINFISILQKFNISMPKGKKADLNSTYSLALLPKPQELCFIRRH